MSEPDATYYQQHKDDDDEWEEAPAPPARRPKRRLEAIVSVRFSPTELDVLREAAGRRGQTVSTFVRTAALGAANGLASAVSTTGTTRWTESISSGPSRAPQRTFATLHGQLEPRTEAYPIRKGVVLR